MENTEEIYTDFARVYDELMDNTPYEMWCNRLDQLIASYGVSRPTRDAEGILDSERNLVVDLGCGSGRDTKYFLEHGYRVDAIDGSAELCALASEYTGIPVKCQLFQELDASEVYDGIWACSSLLHLSYGELDEVLYRIEKALKPQGILYMSFKYGVFEGERNGRYFLDFTEEKLEQLLKKHISLQQLRNFLTEDVRPDREERWLNLFLKKINS